MNEKLKHLSIAKKLQISFGYVLLATSIIFLSAIISLNCNYTVQKLLHNRIQE